MHTAVLKWNKRLTDRRMRERAKAYIQGAMHTWIWAHPDLPKDVRAKMVNNFWVNLRQYIDFYLPYLPDDFPALLEGTISETLTETALCEEFVAELRLAIERNAPEF